VPYGVFEAGDGPVVITVGNNGQYRRFCEQVLDRPDLVADPRFATNLDRSRNRAAFIPVLEAELAKWERVPLIARLRAAGIPCGEVMGLREALTCDRAQEAGLVVAAPGNAHVIAPPYRLDGRRLPVRRMPPSLGDSSREILAERLDYPDAARDALVAKGVLR
jgi:crotonobetainyl-CoA:carnitine CoA-transferase CaiB-like acyl-CoA transferase